MNKMRVLSLNDDDLVINAEILNEAEYIVELEAGEIIADFDRLHNLTNEEILDETDDEEAQYALHEETLDGHGQGYTEYDDMGSIDSTNVVFVRLIDLVENLDESQLEECAFYLNQAGGYAYEIVDRDSD
jgi:hypothetical protein